MNVHIPQTLNRMIVPLGEIPQHRNVVLTLYRNLIRNLIRVPIPSANLHINEMEDKLKLINYTKHRFNKQKTQTNYRVIQDGMLKTAQLNDGLVKYLNEGVISSDVDMIVEFLIKFGRGRKEEINTQEEKESRATRIEEEYVFDEDEQDNTRLISEVRALIKETKLLPEESDLRREQEILKGWMRYYIRERRKIGLIPSKSKLDPAYVNDILKSKMLYHRGYTYLRRLSDKLQNEKLRAGRLQAISGTKYSLIDIRTPWNEAIITSKNQKENFKYKQRKRYDDNLVNSLALESYKREWFQLYKDEMEWENRINDYKGLQKDQSWLWLFNEYNDQLQEENYENEGRSIDFNKRQQVIYQQMQPKFAKLTEDSIHNMEMLLKYKKFHQIGAFTDLVDGQNLSRLIFKHGFKSPTRLKSIDIT